MPPTSAPSVSVVLPTYNRAGSILASVNSVLNQSFSDIELLVVDDASEDDTLEILGRIRDPRLRVIELDRNGGPSTARNIGIRESRSSFVAFHDSDDEWLPQKLEKQLARMAAAGPGIIGAYCGMIIIIPRPDRPKVVYFPEGPRDRLEGNLLPELLVRSIVSTQTLIVRREALAAGGFDASLLALEDWDYMLRFAQGGRIAFVDEPLVVQRFSPNSITWSERKRVLSRAQIVEKNIDILRDQPGVLAGHYHTIGGGYAALGEPELAREFLWRALRLSPLRARTWINLVRSFWPRRQGAGADGSAAPGSRPAEGAG